MEIQLFNNDSFQAFIAKKKPEADLRITQHASQTQIEAGWFDRITSQAEGGDFEKHGSVALIRCEGALEYKYSIWSWIFDSSCYMGIAAKVHAAASDTNVKKIVLYIDSPGGTTHGLPEAANAIFEARSEKPIVAVVDPTAASAAYWLASQCSEIVGIESSWYGSIGTQLEYWSLYNYYKELGVDVEVLRSKNAPSKNSNHPMEPIKEEAKAEWQKHVDNIGSQFTAHVARGRGQSVEHVESKFGGGSMLFAPEAINVGMVDRISTLHQELDASDDASDSSQSEMSSSLEALSYHDLI